MQQCSIYSRPILTASNNRYQCPHQISEEPDILAERRARTDVLIHQKPSWPQRSSFQRLLQKVGDRPPTSPKASTASDQRPVKMAKVEVEEDIQRLPESSDEEGAEGLLQRRVESILTPENTQVPRPKRGLSDGDGNRRTSKRPKSSGTTTLSTTIVNSAPQSSIISVPGDLPWEVSSQSSQKRRSKYGGKKHLKMPTATPESPHKVREQDVPVPCSLPSTPTSKHQKVAKSIELPLEVLLSPKVVQGLVVPRDDTSSDADENYNAVTHANVRIPYSSHIRQKSSTSSLSSVDSIASLQLDKTTKNRLNTDILPGEKAPLPTDQLRCPRCKRTTIRGDLAILKAKPDVTGLSRSELHRFCYDHRLRDAKIAWEKANYPEFDLSTFTSTDVFLKQLAKLPSLIRREQDSFYLTKLDKAIDNAKGNQGKINHFFQSEILSYVHNGYYGPRGAKTISAAIVSNIDIAKSIKRVAKKDKAFRIANLARIVDCVLLPELLVRLVQNDQCLKLDSDGEAEARKILKDSEDLGIMLNGNDDDDVAERDTTLTG